MLLLKINIKAYKERPMTSSHMTLSDLERSNVRSLIYVVKNRVGPCLILTLIGKHIWGGGPMTLSNLRSKSKFEALYLVKERS